MKNGSGGAGDGNRTRVTCLEGRCSTIELHRQVMPRTLWHECPGLPVFPGCQITKTGGIMGGDECSRPHLEPITGLEPVAY